MRIHLDVEKILKQIRASDFEFCEARPATLPQDAPMIESDATPVFLDEKIFP
jgi:hypothetical protein